VLDQQLGDDGKRGNTPSQKRVLKEYT